MSKIKLAKSLFYLFSSTGFLLSYVPQKALFYSNQNSYFLHGLANAGLGYLNKDWLANTTDPFPFFSLLVKLIYLFLGKFYFLILFWLLLLLYFWSLFAIVVAILDVTSFQARSMLSLVIIFLHSSLLANTYLTTNLVSLKSLASFFNDGLAGQYLVGNSLQPSVFGIFILLSIYLLIHNKAIISLLFLVCSVYFHSSYLLISLFIIVGYLTYLFSISYKLSKIFKLFLTYLLLLAPLAFFYLTYANDPSTVKLEAMNILYNFRIPHHANIQFWFDSESFLKIVIIILSFILIKKNKLALILIVPFLLSALLSIIQFLTKNAFLGLIFPWRTSVIILPIASIILIFSLIKKLKFLLRTEARLYLTFPIFAIILLISLYGIKENILENNKVNPKNEKWLYNYVKTSKKANDLYFTPLDLEDFRLETGAPIFIDLKSHPYKASELLEWFQRIQISKQLVNPDSSLNKNLISRLKTNYKITQFIFDKYKIKLKNESPFKRIYENNRFFILE